METVIKLNGINKIYRTDEVETQALENVNLEVRKGVTNKSKHNLCNPCNLWS